MTVTATQYGEEKMKGAMQRPSMRTKIPKAESYGIKLMNSSNGVYTKNVGIPNVAVSFFRKPNRIHKAFMGGITSVLESDKEMKDSCDVVLVTTLKNPDTDMPLQIPNKVGIMYPVEVVVLATGGAYDVSCSAMKLAKKCTLIAKRECRLEWRYGVPKFMYKGDITSEKVLPLCHYIVSKDCFVVMKRIYKGIKTKEDLLNHVERDLIIKEIFGDLRYGVQVINNITKEVFDTL